MLPEFQIERDKSHRIQRSGWLPNYRLPLPNRVGVVARKFKAKMRANATRKSKSDATIASCRGLPSWHPAARILSLGESFNLHTLSN
jgi:hypothetical protein